MFVDRMKFFTLIYFCILNFGIINAKIDDGDDGFVETETDEQLEDVKEIEVPYVTPKDPPNAYFAETFDDIQAVEKRWIRSKAKKENVDEDIAKYDGVWVVEPVEKDPLIGDGGLVLKSKAKHAAISVALKKPFIFKDKPLVIQYEVNLQNGQECGGAYIKLLSHNKSGQDLKGFHDKTPYTIMFGPDKCGNDQKFHFIFRHVNPLTKEIEEKHCKRPDGKIDELFKDHRPHLLTLILQPDNTFQILLDHQVINSGNLMEDFNPSVNPPKEIDDPSDTRPDNWDEREKIPDPDARKPDDWEEDAPQQIIDSAAVKPSGWLDDEPELIPDPEAAKPDDWDDEMDGEWEAPLVSNPVCTEAPGCGEWKAPMIENPKYKGKWKPSMITNPNYKGKWTPRTITNPDFFEDLEPFKMTSIGAIGIELWSMSNGIYFDNFLVTDSVAEALQFSAETFDLKIIKLEKGQKGIVSQVMEYSNKNPWMYGVYVLILAVPIVLIFVCCCAEDKEAQKKKTDEPTEDDPQVLEDEEEKDAGEKIEAEDEDVEEEKEEEEVEDDKEEVEEIEDDKEEVEEIEEEKGASSSDKEASKSEDESRKSPRLRKVRKE